MNMNLFLFSMVFTAASLTWADTTFECYGLDGEVQLNAVLKEVGNPTVTIKVADQNRVPMDGFLSSVTSTETPLGTLLNATVTHPGIADAPSRAYGVFLPTIRFGAGKKTTRFQTQLLSASVGGFLALPAVYQRIQTATSLQCNATSNE